MGDVLYFAYGSNLEPSRMLARVPSARAAGRARLPERRLAFDKRGRDGTGKANCPPAAGETVWGALYRLDPADWPALDACETGYERIEVSVLTDSGEAVPACTYEARQLLDPPLPRRDYKQLVLDGGREHGLPEDYLARIAAAPECDGRQR